METNREFLVNPSAESVLNSVAGVILVFGWVLAIIGVGVGIYAAKEEGVFLYAIAGVIGGALIIFSSYIIWAQFKVIVNMSRSLYNINDALDMISTTADKD